MIHETTILEWEVGSLDLGNNFTSEHYTNAIATAINNNEDLYDEYLDLRSDYDSCNTIIKIVGKGNYTRIVDEHVLEEFLHSINDLIIEQ